MFELIGVLLPRPAVANIDRLDQSSDKACRLVVSLPDLLFISARLDLLYPKHLTFALSNSLPSLSQVADLGAWYIVIPFLIFLFPKHLTFVLSNSLLYPSLSQAPNLGALYIVIPSCYFRGSFSIRTFLVQAHNPKYPNLVHKARGHCTLVSMCGSIWNKSTLAFSLQNLTNFDSHEWSMWKTYKICLILFFLILFVQTCLNLSNSTLTMPQSSSSIPAINCSFSQSARPKREKSQTMAVS